MGINCGILGLPNVGKSTLFNALTAAKAQVANYPFCTIDPNVGIVAVPDTRLQKLSELYRPKKETPATVEFVDIAGLVKGASQGEGLGNKFLSHVREVNALVHVVRCFEDPDVVHVHGEVNPIHDIEIIETELALADLEALLKRIDRAEKKKKTGDKSAVREMEFLQRLKGILEAGERMPDLSAEEKVWLREYNLLTAKPVLYLANVSEKDIRTGNRWLEQVKEIAAKKKTDFVVVSGAIEAEIATLTLEEKKEYLAELGLEESGLARLIRKAYHILSLITFFTAGKDECRAWTILNGTRAPQAAGQIHSDIEKGFIRAEVFRYEDLILNKTEAAIKEKGLLRLEGKEYIVQDGDVIYFRFNV
ncbi:MAG: redox-regulated ATPase YchF [Nitrospirae bacterium]|nr:redox-regulated ATPase YchF [Nitrospirota bacterium]MBI3594446.1 redox-regulated ATPase YchF [Nitrospirota bacterium]